MRVTAGRAKMRCMPRILITTETGDAPEVAVMLSERVATSDLASDHFAAQLIQRIGWALADAENSERDPAGHPEPRGRGALADTFMQTQLLTSARAGPRFT